MTTELTQQKETGQTEITKPKHTYKLTQNEKQKQIG